jgi:hypothetical protein
MVKELFRTSLPGLTGGVDFWVSVRRDFGPELRSESSAELRSLFNKAQKQC